MTFNRPVSLLTRLIYIFLLIGLTFPLTAQFDIRTMDPPASFEGEFGLTFAAINDLDGDGHYELVVGSRIDSVSGIYAAGRVYVISGITGAVIFTIESPNPEVFGLFGRHVAKSDDTNNDGFDDIIVAAWNEDHSEIEDAGRAYLFSGFDGSLLHTFISVEPVLGEFWYDSPVCGVGDLNSDGAGDVAIGVKLGRTSGIQTGRVDVFSGRDGSLLYSLVSPDPKSGGFFGTSHVSYADINNDGVVDMAVGAEQEDIDGISRCGKVHVFSGFDGTHLFSIASPNPDLNGYFGHSITALDDLNGDGVADLLVGAIQEKYSQGRAYVFSGANGDLIHSLQSPDTSQYAYFGESVSKINDLNNDGICEILVGAPLTEFVPRNAGATFIFDGSTGNLLHSLSSPNQEENAFFGQTVAYVSELNSYGENEFLICAYSEDPKGRIYAYRLSPSGNYDLPISSRVPSQPRLKTNYPNPFNPSTTIRYFLPNAGDVSISVYDLQGKLVRTLLNGQMPSGEHESTWNGRDNYNRPVASGIYLYQLKAGVQTVSRKMILSR